MKFLLSSPLCTAAAPVGFPVLKLSSVGALLEVPLSLLELLISSTQCTALAPLGFSVLKLSSVGALLEIQLSLLELLVSSPLCTTLAPLFFSVLMLLLTLLRVSSTPKIQLLCLWLPGRIDECALLDVASSARDLVESLKSFLLTAEMDVKSDS